MAARGPETKIKIKLSAEEEKTLKKQSKGLKRAHSIVVRSLIILYMYIGMSISDVSRKLGVNRVTVRKWAIRYAEHGIKGLEDEKRTGRPCVFDTEVILHTIKIACEMPEKYGRSLAKWDCHEIAAELERKQIVESISGESVRRILESQKLKPWRHH